MQTRKMYEPFIRVSILQSSQKVVLDRQLLSSSFVVMNNNETG
jgi:hypothetical protein